MDSRKSAAGALWLIAQPLLLCLVCLPGTAYVIRLLGPRAYGEWAVGSTLAAAPAVLTNLGLSALFVRAVAQDPASAAERLADQLGLRGLLATLSGLLALLLGLGMGYPPTVLACVALSALGIVFGAMGGAATEALQGLQQLRPVAVAAGTAGLLLTALSVAAAAVGAGPVGVAAAYLCGPLVSLILLMGVLRRQGYPLRIRVNRRRCRELLQEARLLGVYHFLVGLSDRAEQLLVPKLVGVADFGFFAAGTLPADRLTVVPDGFATAFYPAMARDAQVGRPAVARSSAHLLALMLGVCLPMAVLTTFLAPAIARLLFPHNVDACRDVMRITIWSLPLLAVFKSLSCGLRANGQFDRVARAGIGATLLSVGLAFFLVRRFGLPGACLSWVARPALAAVFLVPPFVRTFPPVLAEVPLGRILTSTAAMAVPLWLATVGHAPALPALVTGALVGLVTYVGALILLQVVRASQLAAWLRPRPDGA